MVITASHLSRRFGDRLAVDDVSFELGAGEIFALLGPNGAGKTTTLRMLAGLIAPTSGSVHFNGVPLGRRTAGDLRAHVGFLTEAPGLWERLSVRMNLLVYARLYGVSDPAARVARLLDEFDLTPRAESQAAELSKGMKQKVALARALVHDPPLVLLDEPTAGLDPQTARAVRDLVLGLRGAGRAILISTHNLDEAERIADRVAVLHHRLLALDTPESLRQRLFGRRVRITVAGDAAGFVPVIEGAGARDVRTTDAMLSIGVGDPERETPALVRALVQAGADIRSVLEEEPPLEDVYLTLLDKGQQGGKGEQGE